MIENFLCRRGPRKACAGPAEAFYDGAASGPKPRPPAEAFYDGAASGPKPRPPAEAMGLEVGALPMGAAPPKPPAEGSARDLEDGEEGGADRCHREHRREDTSRTCVLHSSCRHL